MGQEKLFDGKNADENSCVTVPVRSGWRRRVGDPLRSWRRRKGGGCLGVSEEGGEEEIEKWVEKADRLRSRLKKWDGGD